ncbi:DegQ family serine endoprotease [Chitinasiproducens palmae]|uniref:Probable periplasmic serine endoprotease DegP-like n=1 Tax=Chitinasiproducens palmae TaxID=1770053 RepID=A0A1H2PUT3_9BURK|nr:DegQ family serine endoprotease [Chitinasiproducens palmae]SDV50988.1 serine protease Do [Chitinasiproducens palmae]
MTASVLQRLVAAAVSCVSLSSVATGVLAAPAPAASAPPVASAPAAAVPASAAVPTAPPAAALPNFADLVERVGPAVVNIRTAEKIQRAQQSLPPSLRDGDMAEFFRRFFGIPLPRGDQRDSPAEPAPSESERGTGLGSGFIISQQGYVMTSAHVVDGADTIYVTLTDKREFKAKLVGIDERTDVAVLKIEAQGLPVVTIGDSDRVRVGEWVVAIGSPFGLDNTVTAGIVSAKGRDTGDYLPFIQTDVAVNPGNSGGPLLNMRGEVIGINSQIYSRTGGFMGISFSIPIDEAMRVADQLRKSGRVTRSQIAVTIGEVSKDVASSLGLPRAQGALVSGVVPGGPAAKAGVQSGDIILKFNGRVIDRATDLPRLVGEMKPGASVPMTIWRKGQSRDVTVLLTEAEGPASAATPTAAPRSAGNGLGIAVADLTESERRALDLGATGVKITLAEGVAAEAGLRRGDVLLRIGNVDVSNAKQFESIVARVPPGKLVPLLIQRGGVTIFIPLRARAADAR